MKEQVLSVSQMEELVNLGIDVSKASMCWILTRSGVQFLIPNKKDSILENILENEYLIDSHTPTFTIQDILEILPKNIENLYPLNIQCFSGKYNVINFDYWRGANTGWLHFCQDMHSTINSAFKLLKWCKQNNYI